MNESETDSYLSSDNSSEELYLENTDANTSSLQPYMYEPPAPVISNDSDVSLEEVDRSSVPVSEWCLCGNCQSMPTNAECICCESVEQISRMCDDIKPRPSCMTLHPGFDGVCLNIWNLQALFFAYRQYYGNLRELDNHRRYRHIAYRHFVRWCYGYLGKHNRIVLPACVVCKIRKAFPDTEADYVGYKLPVLL